MRHTRSAACAFIHACQRIHPARPAPVRRRGCCPGSPRADCAGARDRPSSAETPSTSSAPIGQRDLRELRSVERPVDLDRLDVVERAAAPSRPASHRRSRWTAGRRSDARGSGANARTPPTAAWMSRARVDGLERDAVGAGCWTVSRGTVQPGVARGGDGRDRIGQAIDRRLGDRLQAGGSDGGQHLAQAPRSRRPPGRARSASENAVSGMSPAIARRAPHARPRHLRGTAASRSTRISPALRRPAAPPGSRRCAPRSTRTNVVRVPWRRRRSSSARDADRDQIVTRRECACRFVDRYRAHAFHPCRIRSQISSARCAAASESSGCASATGA